MSADDKQKFHRKAIIIQADSAELMELAYQQLERALLWDAWQAGFYVSHIDRRQFKIGQHEYQHDDAIEIAVSTTALRRFS